jgi:hypothetical protein
MAISPAIYNIRPQKNADFDLTLRFKDSTETVLNLNGWQVLAQVWNKDRSVKYGNFSVTIPDPVLGEAQLLLSRTITAVLPVEGRYDVMLINPGGLREYYLEGIVRPSMGFTTPL